MAGIAQNPPSGVLSPAPRPSLVRAAVALPVLVWVCVAVVWIVGIGAGSDFVFPVPGHVTLSESAALGDRLEIGRQIGEGADPDARGAVRQGLIDERAHVLTPVEAAIAAGRQDIAALLVELGATPP